MSELVDMVCEYEAELRWARGDDPSFSTGLCDNLTCGYGKLDDYGYWQFPLYPAEDYLAKYKERERQNVR